MCDPSLMYDPSMRTLLCIHTVCILSLALPSWAQWIKVPVVPEPKLTAPAPRLANGKPDFSGSWSTDDNKYLRDIAAGMKPDDVPYLPWARVLFDQRKDGSHSLEDPDAHCLPQGVPKIDAVAYPYLGGGS
jgi:hypothetical protein